jgi:hypothetical protein
MSTRFPERLPRTGKCLDRIGHAFERVRAKRCQRFGTDVAEGRRDHDLAAERFGKSLETRHEIDRRADRREVEPVVRADIAVKNVARNQRSNRA